jgi:hypothetical protein
VTPAAAFTDVLGIVVGVLLSLCGLGLVLMGVVAMADRRWRGGLLGALLGLLALALGFRLVGLL